MTRGSMVLLAAVFGGCKSNSADSGAAGAAGVTGRAGGAAMGVTTVASPNTTRRTGSPTPDRIRHLRDIRSSPRCPAGMAFIPGGHFRMGSIGNEPPAITGHPMFDMERSNMLPPHDVAVPPFCLDLAPVTVAEYEACVSTGGCEAPPRYDDAICKSPSDCTFPATSYPDAAFTGHACNWALPAHEEHPVGCVDWQQASNYCRVVARRLPTEIEWERAARGSDGRYLAFGAPSAAPPTCGAVPNKEPTCPVASFPGARSPYGLYDMAFAPREWTATAYCDYPADQCGAVDKAARGGLGVWQALTTSREPVAPGAHKVELTFRCAVEPLRTQDEESGIGDR